MHMPELSFDKPDVLFYLIEAMSLTLNQFLFLVITIAVVAAVSFFISFILQLQRTVKTGEETLMRIKELVESLKETEKKVSARIDDVGKLVETTKKTAASISEIALFISAKILKPSSKYLALLLPLLRFGWRQIKKRKEAKNGR